MGRACWGLLCCVWEQWPRSSICQPGPASAGGLSKNCFPVPPWAGTSLLCPLCCGFSCHLLFLQPYVPKDPPVLRVTEGPFFSEVVAYYEHVHQVVRLYNLPGAPAEEEGPHRLWHALPSARPVRTSGPNKLSLETG